MSPAGGRRMVLQPDWPMNHKRKRPKDRRAGCLLCKPWKSNGSKGRRRWRPGAASWRDGGTHQEMKANASAREQLR